VAVDTYPHAPHEIWSHRGAKDLGNWGVYLGRMSGYGFPDG
jgi:hypothetical protein